MKKKNSRTILALGADIKSRFCILEDDNLILSEDFGNLDNLDNFNRFKSTILKEKIYPDIVAFDMHPNYYSSGLAGELKAKEKLSIQHHHAHIASVFNVKNINKPVIGVAFDGTGYGVDGNIWGGEFLIVNKSKFSRVAHFKYLKMPGGELAIKETYRIAFSLLYDCLGDKVFNQNLAFLKFQPKKDYNILVKMIEQNINCPLTSSAGRLFDAISSILDICHKVKFEAEAAIELEKIASQSKEGSYYEFNILKQDNTYVIGYNKLIESMLRDIKDGLPKQCIAKKFHNSLANLIIEMIDRIGKDCNLRNVVLSGGVFQNKLLFNSVVQKLKCSNYNLIYDENIPLNDLSICIGQAYIAKEVVRQIST